jgi:hypothetical protein
MSLPSATPNPKLNLNLQLDSGPSPFKVLNSKGAQQEFSCSKDRCHVSAHHRFRRSGAKREISLRSHVPPEGTFIARSFVLFIASV